MRFYIAIMRMVKKERTRSALAEAAALMALSSVAQQRFESHDATKAPVFYQLLVLEYLHTKREPFHRPGKRDKTII